jgi:ABC-type nitrate/sulfonate/bicarbonate transport system substrate-binding protein
MRFPSRYTFVAKGLLAVALSVASLPFVGCRSNSPRKVTIGIQVSPAMTLVMVAKDAGLFEKQGLDVELKQFTAGKFALQSFLGGSVDFAVAGDVPVALARQQGNQLRVVAQVVDKTVNEVRVVALRQPTRSSKPFPPGDAHGYFAHQHRRLATSFGGGPEFFTYQFLRHNAIDPADVEIVSQRPEDMPAALQAHSVDAVSIFDPFAFIAQQHLGNDALVFRDPDIYSELYVLTASQKHIDADPDTIAALLRALADAQALVQSDPGRAKQIMQRYTKLDPPVVDGIWSSFSFKLALNRALLDDWTQEADWMRATGKVSPTAPAIDWKSVPETRFLRAIDPDAVQF